MAHPDTLFPTGTPANEWQQFPAAGFAKPACGFIRRRANPATFGMPLGAVDTGCLGIDTDGTLGLCSLFNSYVPMRGPLKLPFLGMSAGKQTWVLSTIPFASNESLYYQNLASPADIHYWGHYPVADIEYETPGSPVGIGVRAWSPFIVGDAAASNTPAAVFEVHLRNATAEPQRGRVVLSFPGPTQEEAQVARGSPRRRASPESALGKRPHTWLPVADAPVRARPIPVEGDFTGLALTTELDNRVGYAIGVIGAAPVSFGRGLGREREAWEKIATGLPGVSDPTDLSRSMAVEYRVAPGGETVLRLVLAWYAPVWFGEADHDSRHRYRYGHHEHAVQRPVHRRARGRPFRRRQPRLAAAARAGLAGGAVRGTVASGVAARIARERAPPFPDLQPVGRCRAAHRGLVPERGRPLRPALGHHRLARHGGHTRQLLRARARGVLLPRSRGV
jgi:hypothetical protein